MKRKELTKFLAVMTATAMIAGNGVSVMASDFSADDLTMEAAGQDVSDDLKMEDEEEQISQETVTADTPDVQSDGFTDGEASAVQAKVSQAETAVNTISVKGQIVNPAQSYTGTVRDAEVTDTVTNYNNKEWKKINLTFESAEAKEEGTNYVELFPTAGTDDILELGTGYNSAKGITGTITAGSDGSYLFSLGNGNGPAQVKKTYYTIVTHADGTEDYYQINICRYGYAGFVFGMKYNENYPLNAFNFGDTTGEIKSTSPLDNIKNWMMGTGYDEKGATTRDYTVKVNPEYKGDNFWVDETGYLHAKRAGMSSDFLVLDCFGQIYPITIIAKYNLTPGKDIFNAKKTDGVTDVTAFADADSFAAIFPDKDKDNARAFFTVSESLNKDVNVDGKWKDGTGAWADTWDSAKLNKVQDLAPVVWANVYGIQDAKDEITAFADIDNEPAESKDALQAVIDKYAGEIDSAYQSGQITSLDKTAEYVAGAKAELKTIKTVAMENCTVTLDTTEYTYDGTAKTPQITVTDDADAAVGAENYQVTYENNTDAGTASVTVTGLGRYKGSVTLNYTIKKAVQTIEAEKTEYSVTEGDKAFNPGAKAAEGSVLTYTSSDPEIVSVDGDGNITPVKEGKATVVITASGNKNYEDAALDIEVTVSKVSFENCKVSLDKTEYTYDGTAKTPQVTVKDADGATVNAENYQVTYKNNTNAGTASVTVTGTGKYKGSITLNYTIKKTAQTVKAQKTKYSVMEGTKAFNLGAKAANGSTLTYKVSDPSVVKVDKKGNVTPVKAGKGTIVITASGNKNYENASLTVEITVTKVPTLVKVTTKSFTKTEGDKAFSLGLKTTAKPTLTYKSGAASVATVNSKGVVTVKGPGYAVITVTAKIKDAKEQKYTIAVTVKPSAKLAPAVSPQKGKVLQVSWKKNSKVSGYQVVVCKDKNFKSNVKTVTIRNNKTFRSAVKVAYSGKKYYVKVRSFKKVSGKTIYGNWSQAVSATSKK